MSDMTILLRNVICQPGGLLFVSHASQVGHLECRLLGVTFPVPVHTGPQKRSIAERDRTIVFVTAVVSLLPGSVILGRLIESPWLHLGATFVCCYATVIVVVLVLRARFLRRARASTWLMHETSRPIPRKAVAPVEALHGLGFTVTNVVAVADDSGRVFTKPLVVLTRVSAQHVAIVSAHGQQIVSLLSNGQWLVTATTKVVKHDTVIAQTVTDASPATLVSTHENAVVLLAELGMTTRPQERPIESALHLERLEQQILCRLHEQGISPRASVLLESGAVLTDGTIGSRTIRTGDNPPMAFHTP